MTITAKIEAYLAPTETDTDYEKVVLTVEKDEAGGDNLLLKFGADAYRVAGYDIQTAIEKVLDA